jgi:hypothetical protein
LAAQGFSITLADLQAMDELEPAVLEGPLALLQAHDFYRQWGAQPEKIDDDGLLGYYATIEELRKDQDA